MSEVQEVVKKAKAEVTLVDMTDGRSIGFAGSRNLMKDVLIVDGQVHVRFDFRNGETRLFTVPESLLLQFAGHGASQKIGDQTAGVKDVEDMVIAIDDTISHLAEGKWSAPREGGTGDGFSGAGVVIRAIMEASGKGQADVKAFLQGKLDAAVAAGEKLSRQALYAAFRNPQTKVGQIIARLEQDKVSKSAAVDADALLGELG